MSFDERLKAQIGQVEQGGAAKYHTKNRELGKLFARERISLLLDQGSFFEDAKLANNADPELPSDGVITGLGRIEGRPVAVMANDSTVKAGSWGRRTVEKIIRIQEVAQRQRWPLFYLVDSAGCGVSTHGQKIPARPGPAKNFLKQSYPSAIRDPPSL